MFHFLCVLNTNQFKNRLCSVFTTFLQQIRLKLIYVSFSRRSQSFFVWNMARSIFQTFLNNFFLLFSFPKCSLLFPPRVYAKLQSDTKKTSQSDAKNCNMMQIIFPTHANHTRSAWIIAVLLKDRSDWCVGQKKGRSLSVSMFLSRTELVRVQLKLMRRLMRRVTLGIKAKAHSDLHMSRALP